MSTTLKGKCIGSFSDTQVLARFKKAAETFVKSVNGTVHIWASSTDWFQQEWGRDTFIALPGLLLVTGRFEDAKQNIKHFSRHEKNGLIPNRILDPLRSETIEYNTADGSMWFIQAVKKYLETTEDWNFIEDIFPVLRNIVTSYKQGTGYHRYGRFNKIFMDSDGLIVSPAQATWMDADPDGRDCPVTPRNGKAVEVNALWYANLKFLARVESELGKQAECRDLRELAEQVKESFNEKFYFATAENAKTWGNSGGSLYDVIEGDPHSGAVRPNMIFALSHAEDLLSGQKQAEVFEAVTCELLTPYGLRTLSPRDSHYCSRYFTEKPPAEKDLAYHQGTVWPWLMGPYCDGLVKVRTAEGRSKNEIEIELRMLLFPLVEFLMTGSQQSLPEVFDGKAPHGPGGTRSQAWSVAEVLRVLIEHCKV